MSEMKTITFPGDTEPREIVDAKAREDIELLKKSGVEGPPGEDGNDGVSATHSWNGTVLTVTSASGTSSADLKGEKGDKGDTGDKGEKGEKGDTGADGTGVTILGSFESVNALKAAHPTGSVGDAYLVSGNLYVWSATENAWTNVGNIQGPKGDKGDKGDTGAAGANGKDGADGKTPVRGEDYWTDSDIAEIKSYVDDAILQTVNNLPNAGGGFSIPVIDCVALGFPEINEDTINTQTRTYEKHIEIDLDTGNLLYEKIKNGIVKITAAAYGCSSTYTCTSMYYVYPGDDLGGFEVAYTDTYSQLHLSCSVEYAAGELQYACTLKYIPS